MKQHAYFFALCLFLLIGSACAFSRVSEYIVDGKNLVTPYGKGDAVITVRARTQAEFLVGPRTSESVPPTGTGSQPTP